MRSFSRLASLTYLYLGQRRLDNAATVPPRRQENQQKQQPVTRMQRISIPCFRRVPSQTRVRLRRHANSGMPTREPSRVLEGFSLRIALRTSKCRQSAHADLRGNVSLRGLGTEVITATATGRENLTEFDFGLGSSWSANGIGMYVPSEHRLMRAWASQPSWRSRRAQRSALSDRPVTTVAARHDRRASKHGFRRSCSRKALTCLVLRHD